MMPRQAEVQQAANAPDACHQMMPLLAHISAGGSD